MTQTGSGRRDSADTTRGEERPQGATGNAKSSWDIEAALAWAVSEVDQASRPGRGGFAGGGAMLQAVTLGTIVDGSGTPESQRAFTEADPAAVAVVDAVRAEPERVVEVDADEAARLLGPLAHWAAGRDLIWIRRVQPAMIVLTAAKLRRRPDWIDGFPALVAIGFTGKTPIAHGSWRWEMLTPGRRGKRRMIWADGSHCPVAPVPEMGHYIEARLEYAAWHGVLRRLADAFPVLAGRRVTGPAADAEPWVARREKVGRVLRGGVGVQDRETAT